MTPPRRSGRGSGPLVGFTQPRFRAKLHRLIADPDMFAEARCVGQWRLFDERGPDESAEDAHGRHLAAVQLCAGCPARLPCGELAVALKSRQPCGVWAGRIPYHRRKESTE